MDAVATLTVLMGPPGAGKTTWLQANQYGQVVCSTERLRTDPRLLRSQRGVVAFLAQLRDKAEDALAAGQDVVIDGCNTRRADRSLWLGIARRHGAQTHLVVLDTPAATTSAVQRARTRGVPEAKMQGYQADFARALRVIGREGWGAITHIRRDGDCGRIRLEPKRVSSW